MESTMTPNHCVEVATFKLKPGITDDQLLALEARIRNGRIAAQAGFIGRELCNDESTGDWLMVMRFDSRANMDSWLAVVKTVPEMRELGGMIDSFGCNRFFAHRA
jgi:antibiotic biosynthesis monooxygenase (ABM) superfamily enzyme